MVVGYVGTLVVLLGAWGLLRQADEPPGADVAVNIAVVTVPTVPATDPQVVPAQPGAPAPVPELLKAGVVARLLVSLGGWTDRQSPWELPTPRIPAGEAAEPWRLPGATFVRITGARLSEDGGLDLVVDPARWAGPGTPVVDPEAAEEVVRAAPDVHVPGRLAELGPDDRLDAWVVRRGGVVVEVLPSPGTP